DIDGQEPTVSASKESPAEPGASIHELGERQAGGLTERQRLVLETIRRAVSERGYPPSMREIGEAVGLTSPSSVKHQLTVLEKKGYVRRDPNRPRAIEIVASAVSAAPGLASQLSAEDGTDAPQARLVPVVGRIAAGGPILAEQVLED